MTLTENILHILEKGDEEYKLSELKKSLNLYSDRTARVVLHILETSPDKYTEKLHKEIRKLEEKLTKEYKKLHKKMESYTTGFTPISNHKLRELGQELEEMQKLL